MQNEKKKVGKKIKIDQTRKQDENEKVKSQRESKNINKGHTNLLLYTVKLARAN